MANGRPYDAPAAREIGDREAAELNAVVWLRWLGHPQAQPTSAGADGGIDVSGSAAFAQVKWQDKAVGGAELQQLCVARANRPGTMYFFTNAGYSRPASAYADRVGMATFSYSPATGLITPVSKAARRIFEAREARHEAGARNTRQSRPDPPTTTTPPATDTLADELIRTAAGPSHDQRPGGHDDADRLIIDVEPVSGRTRLAPELPARQVGTALAIAGFGVMVLCLIIDERMIDGETPVWFAVIGMLALVAGLLGLVLSVRPATTSGVSRIHASRQPDQAVDDG